MQTLETILRQKLNEGVSPHYITNEAFNTLIEAMREACRQACEEQKNLCDKEVENGSMASEAPLPELI